MRSAVSSFVALFPAVAVAGPTPPGRTSARTWVSSLLGAAASRLAVLIGGALLIGIAISIVTTTDPLWWHLHFSRLGTFKNGSAAFFNGALIVGGILTVVYARAAARELRALAPGRVRRGAARTTRVMYSIMGVNLALVGCVPLNSNGFVHDRVAGGMVLGFVGLLVTSPFLMHRMPRRLHLVTAFVFATVFAGAWVFVTGQINLALFEVISFVAIFGWSGAFLGCMALAARRDAALAEAAIAQASIAPIAVAQVAVAVLPATVAETSVAADETTSSVSGDIEAGPIVVVPVVTAATPTPAAVGASAALLPVETGPQTGATRQLPPPAAPAVSAQVRSGQHAVPRRPRPAHRLAARPVARVRPRRGCTASAARATSARSKTPIRR